MEAVPKSFSFFSFMHPKPTIIILSYSFRLLITTPNSFLFKLAFQEIFLSHLSPFKCKSRNIYFCFIDYAKAYDCVDHNKLWKILKAMGIPDHLTCLLRNLYADQEATVRTGHGTTDSKSGKEYIKAVYCHPSCLTYMQSPSWEMLAG